MIKNIHELLNEEKWTRAALNSYSINNFKELDTILKDIIHEKKEDEVKEICDQHLKHSKNSIIALYLAGIISLSKKLVDDSNIIVLINLFEDNHKWNIVEYLCKRILDYGENKFALKTLAHTYENLNDVDKRIEIWERLIKIDYEETEIVKLLADVKAERGEIESAVEYYKKALHRFVNKKMFSNVKEIWNKLIEDAPEDYEFYYRVEKKVANSLSGDRSAVLLNTLYTAIKDKAETGILISILKKILEYEPKNPDARHELIRCFKIKYQAHSQLEEYLRISNINQSWRNIHDAISDFEKHIEFDKDNFVFHRSWGIGRIRDIKHDTFVIDFAQKKNHSMSLKMAISALKVLGGEHIWVLKGIMPKEELKEKVKSDPAWALRVIIKSYENETDMKKIKAELVPEILSVGEWTKWNTEARKCLKTDPYFGNLAEKREVFEVRDTPISFEEKMFNKFRSEKNFYTRLQTLEEFLKEGDPDSDYFDEMFNYFIAFAKNFTNVSEFVITSYLFIQSIVGKYQYLNPGFDYSFKDLLDKVDDIYEIFAKIEENDLKREFLIQIKETEENWPEYFMDLFKYYLNRFIIEELVQAGKLETIHQLFLYNMNHYRESREPFIWLVRNISEEPWFPGYNIPFEKILINMIHLLDITFREISNRRDVSLNRKLNKHIQDFLFKDNKLVNFLMITDEDSITRLYTLVEDVKELDPSLKIELKIKIKDKYPNFRFFGKMDMIETKSRGILVTRKGYEAKQKELKHIIEVEVPQNSHDIGKAMEKGDLRENAEYKAALEKQDILNAQATKLQDELSEAQIFDESTIVTDLVSFHTKVTLDNLLDNRQESYIILGPWESEPSQNIISYLSPLGAKITSHKQGEELKFTINEKKFHYKISAIVEASIK